MEKVYIFGHKVPDTDSITSAIALEYLKKSQGMYAEARSLGELNDETKYVLDRFNIKYPKYLNDVKLQIKDIDYHRNLFISDKSSIEDLHNYMYDNNVTGVPVINKNGLFLNLITAKHILKDIFNTENETLNTSST